MQTSFEKEYVEEDKQLELPPGFRFYPSDEELVSHYLTPKVFDPSFSCLAIGEADLNKCEPWDLPWRAKMGEKEWYFFSLKDRKYPTGFRTNRATESGYWKATGKDKEIYKMKTLIGMKKTLVFYTGRAPKGLKTNWVIHEFRLDGKFAAENVPKSGENEWVISRVFEKCSGGKKIHITNKGQNGQSISQHHLPPLMDSSPTFTSSQSRTEHDSFSNPTIIQPQNTAKHELLAPPQPPPPLPFSSAEAQFVQNFESSPQDQNDIVRNMVEICRWNNNSQNQTRTQTQNGFLHFSSGGMIQEDVDYSSAAAGYNSSGLDLIWSYFMQ